MQLTSFVANMTQASALLWHASPRALVLTILTNLLTAMVPAALIYLGAQLIEQLSSGSPAAAVMALAITYICLSGFQESLGAISSFSVDTLQDATKFAIHRDVNRAIATFPDLQIHESNELRETAILALRTAERMSDLISHTYGVFMGITIIVPLLLLTGNIVWWIPALMLAGMVPLVLLRARAERSSWDVQEQHAGTFNTLRLLERVLTQPEFAKDLRIYQMQDALLSRWDALYTEFLAALKGVRVRNAFALIGASLFAGACLGAPLYVVVTGYTNGRFSVAELAIFLGSLLQLKESLSAVIFNFGDMLGETYAVGPYRQLMARCADQATPNRPCHLSDPNASLRLHQVSLRYAGADHPALSNVNLKIPAGQTLAIVGDNGAGKTSLLNLLCGLYQPTSGCLIWPTVVPPKIAGVLQGAAHFPLTPLDNLATKDRACATQCVTAVGLEFLSMQLDTPLTIEMPDGTDLSGGQWQRLAIARAMAHADDADLLVFDEPTTALDPESEADIMRKVLNLCAGKTAVIVSHRLALTRFVDRIIVMDHGRVIEDGSHSFLLKANGKYARMFRTQAAFYQ